MASSTGSRAVALAPNQPSRTSTSTSWKSQRIAMEVHTLPPVMHPDIVNAAEGVKAAFAAAKTAQRAARQADETRLNSLATSDRPAWRTAMQTHRESTIEGHHISYAALEPHLPAGVTHDNGRLLHGTTEIAKIHFGNDRFQNVSYTGLAAGQSVFRKRGTDKEYVLDATGNLVKRFVARMDEGSARTGPTLMSSTFLRKDWDKGFEGVGGSALSIQDKAVMQNVKGGGAYRRALSTTASKYPILSNAGDSFGSGPHPVASVFDLAMVAPRQIYKGYDRTADPALTGIKHYNAKTGRTFSAADTLSQFRWSSAKNKEVYLTSDVSHARLDLSSTTDRRVAVARAAFPTLP